MHFRWRCGGCLVLAKPLAEGPVSLETVTLTWCLRALQIHKYINTEASLLRVLQINLAAALYLVAFYCTLLLLLLLLSTKPLHSVIKLKMSRNFLLALCFSRQCYHFSPCSSHLTWQIDDQMENQIQNPITNLIMRGILACLCFSDFWKISILMSLEIPLKAVSHSLYVSMRLEFFKASQFTWYIAWPLDKAAISKLFVHFYHSYKPPKSASCDIIASQKAKIGSSGLYESVGGMFGMQSNLCPFIIVGSKKKFMLGFKKNVHWVNHSVKSWSSRLYEWVVGMFQIQLDPKRFAKVWKTKFKKIENELSGLYEWVVGMFEMQSNPKSPTEESPCWLLGPKHQAISSGHR